VEKHYPFDRLYAVGSDFSRFSLFAIQFKAPERSGKGLRFRLESRQLQQSEVTEYCDMKYLIPLGVNWLMACSLVISGNISMKKLNLRDLLKYYMMLRINLLMQS